MFGGFVFGKSTCNHAVWGNADLIDIVDAEHNFLVLYIAVGCFINGLWLVLSVAQYLRQLDEYLQCET